MLKKILFVMLLSTSIFGVDIIVDTTVETTGWIRDDINEIVIGNNTSFMWQDNSYVKTVKRDWNEAMNYCQKLNLAGFDDWYLPTKKQLMSIVDTTRQPTIKQEFIHSISNYYWSVNTSAKTAWSVFLYDGKQYYDYKTTKSYSRCVRDRKISENDTLYFEILISKLIQKELNQIPKPPAEIKIIRDEFETTLEFNDRIAQTKKEQKINIENYKKNYASAKLKAENKAIKTALETIWGKPILSNLKYDADNGYFVADIAFETKKSFKKKVAIKVERKSARGFKKAFAKTTPQAIFDYDAKSIKLKDINILYNKESYLAQFTDINIGDTRVAVNLKNDINMNMLNAMSSGIVVGINSVSTFDASSLNNFSELDKLLDSSAKVEEDKTKWLFVVGIEKYEFTDNISYAKRSAEMFVKVAHKNLGVKKVNSFVMINDGATQAKIKTNMKKMLRRVKDGDTIYFYYNGHGVPVPNQNNAPFMLTADTEPDFVGDEQFFSLQNIYNKLSDSKAKKIVAVVDSCFSGVTDGKAVLKGVAATKMVAKSVSFDKEKMVVLSAGKSNQYSNGYNKKGHRLFSFFVMKNIIEGDSTIKQIYKDTKDQTYDVSLEEYGDSRTQEPTIEGNYRLDI